MHLAPPSLKFKRTSLLIISAMCAHFKIKHFQIVDSILVASIEQSPHKAVPRALLVVNLSDVLDSKLMKISLSTKNLKYLLKMTSDFGDKHIVLDDMSFQGKSNKLGHKLAYTLKNSTSILKCCFYAVSSNSPQVLAPSLKNAQVLFKSRLSKRTAEFVHYFNTEFKYRHSWRLLAARNRLETIQQLDTEGMTLTLCKVNDLKFNDEEANFVVHLNAFIGPLCQQEVEVKVIKTADTKYWAVSDFLYKNMNIRIFDSVELISFVPFSRSTTEINDFLNHNFKFGVTS